MFLIVSWGSGQLMTHGPAAHALNDKSNTEDWYKPQAADTNKAIWKRTRLQFLKYKHMYQTKLEFWCPIFGALELA